MNFSRLRRDVINTTENFDKIIRGVKNGVEPSDAANLKQLEVIPAGNERLWKGTGNTDENAVEDGDYRRIVLAGDFLTQKRELGAWVTKDTIS